METAFTVQQSFFFFFLLFSPPNCLSVSQILEASEISVGDVRGESGKCFLQSARLAQEGFVIAFLKLIGGYVFLLLLLSF